MRESMVELYELKWAMESLPLIICKKGASDVVFRFKTKVKATSSAPGQRSFSLYRTCFHRMLGNTETP